MTIVRTGGVLTTYLANQGSSELAAASPEAVNQLHERLLPAAGQVLRARRLLTAAARVHNGPECAPRRLHRGPTGR
ncbi:hypothetical protein ACFWF9_19155 [Streptomyces roseolus]|uniref:hypothetical protein n=1 Tax=Streptomyces roseolus TaxID=67358 RepID=UPI003647A752